MPRTQESEATIEVDHLVKRFLGAQQTATVISYKMLLDRRSSLHWISLHSGWSLLIYANYRTSFRMMSRFG